MCGVPKQTSSPLKSIHLRVPPQVHTQAGCGGGGLGLWIRLSLRRFPVPCRGLIWIQAHPQKPAAHSCREHSGLLFPYQPGAPGGERQLGPLVGAQMPLCLGSAALPIPVPLWASLSSSVKWACSHPCPTSNLPIPLSDPPSEIHPSHLVWLSIKVSEWAHDPSSANQILSWENQKIKN